MSCNVAAESFGGPGASQLRPLRAGQPSEVRLVGNADEVPRVVRAVRQQFQSPLDAILSEVDQLARRGPYAAEHQSLASIRRAVRDLEEVSDQVLQVVGDPRADPMPPQHSTESRGEAQQSAVGQIRAHVRRLQLVLWVGEQVALPSPSTVRGSENEVILNFERRPDLVAWADWGALDIEAGPTRITPTATCSARPPRSSAWSSVSSMHLAPIRVRRMTRPRGGCPDQRTPARSVGRPIGRLSGPSTASMSRCERRPRCP